MAGPSCAEGVLRDLAGNTVTVTGNKLDVNASSVFSVTTVPDGDATILQSTVVIAATTVVLVAAVNANRRFIEINWKPATAGTVAYLGLYNTVGVLTNFFQEMEDNGVFWLDNNIVIGSTFYIYTADTAGGIAGVLQY